MMKFGRRLFTFTIFTRNRRKRIIQLLTSVLFLLIGFLLITMNVDDRSKTLSTRKRSTLIYHKTYFKLSPAQTSYNLSYDKLVNSLRKRSVAGEQKRVQYEYFDEILSQEAKADLYHHCRKLTDLNCQGIIEGRPEFLPNATQWTLPKDWLYHPGIFLQEDNYDCDELMNFLKLPNASLSTVERDFPLAFVILVRSKSLLHQFVMLFRRIYWPQNAYCIHLDPELDLHSIGAVEAMSRCFPNVYVAEKHNATWRTPNELKASINCLRHLEAQENAWKYVQIVDTREFPLRTNRETVEIFKILNGTNDIDLLPNGEKMPAEKTDQAKIALKKTNKSPTSIKLNIGTSNSSNINTEFSSFSTPIFLRLYQSSLPPSLTREFVRFALWHPVAVAFYKWILSNSNQNNNTFRDVFWATLIHNVQLNLPGGYNTSWLPNCLLKTGEKNNGISYNSIPSALKLSASLLGSCNLNETTLSTNCGVFELNSLPKLVQRPEIMAHGFDVKVQPATLYCLDEWVCNRTYIDSNNVQNVHESSRSFLLQHYERQLRVRYHKAKWQKRTTNQKEPCQI